MSKSVMAREYTKNAITDANALSKERYKEIKHMDKIQLANLLRRIYERGYRDAVQVMAAKAQQQEAAGGNEVKE